MMRNMIVALLAITSLLFAACAPAATQQGSAPAAPPAQGKPQAGAAATDASNTSASTTSASGPLAEIVAGAAKEGRLSAMWSQTTLGGAQGFQEIGDAINKKYGLNLTYEWAPGPPMPAVAEKIAQEQAANQPATTDVYVGTDAQFAYLGDRKLLRVIDWQTLSGGRITPEIAEAGNIGVKVSSRLVGVPYNTNLVKGDDVPQQLSDVLNPKWKGKIASTSYAAMLPHVASPKMVGPEKMDAFVQQLAANVGGLMRCGEEQRVASGEFAMLVLDCGRDATDKLQADKAPIDHAVLKDAALINIERLGVPVNSAHPNAATLFILFLSTPEGQDLHWKLDYLDVHLYPESRQAKRIKEYEAKGYTFVPMTTENFAGFDVDSYTTKYTQILSNAKP
jgi:iron(III) transport system substrate-binding protein